MVSLTREILEEILDAKLAPLEDSLNCLYNQYQNLLNKFNGQEMKLKELTAENSGLKADIGILEKSVQDYQVWLNDLEQYGRRNGLTSWHP